MCSQYQIIVVRVGLGKARSLRKEINADVKWCYRRFLKISWMDRVGLKDVGWYKWLGCTVKKLSVLLWKISCSCISQTISLKKQRSAFH
jgi:hypothetical protein